MSHARTGLVIISVAAMLGLAGCGGEAEAPATEATNVSEDPFGATGAPGSDMTDKGANDGAFGVADDAGSPAADGRPDAGDAATSASGGTASTGSNR